jgi:anti-sigma regulatory factor (Ser/Thr protein kinase)
MLPPEAASVTRVRRWASAQTAPLGPAVASTVELVVSELVTNSVLHAGTDIVVEIHRFPDRIRVDVADRSGVRPVIRDFDADAATGRGLSLLQRVVDEWGVEQIPGGKVVWFELPVDVPEPSRAAPGDGPLVGSPRFDLGGWPELPRPAPPARSDGRAGLLDVHLRAIPIAVMRVATEEHQALVRELRLILDRHPDDRGSLASRVLEALDDLTAHLAAARRDAPDLLSLAARQGRPVVDLHLRVPDGIGELSARCDALLDEADRSCRSADLLTMPASPASAALRRWMLAELAGQAKGAAPTPFPVPPVAGRTVATRLRPT